ncbi:zinc finger BED domain-containing protein RICESLEEPER 2-like [Solanum verrucosum]|uniref:zinc finger BED domain-containing protein RICESLEEPER 2-like n=1 Tax=Solanum verrucosum TaxID=315347 RepID=UPI0020D02220|nr:zinc finger BED domain-containing protein RICESLEEPER 2-like [Solanum verrucosum]
MAMLTHMLTCTKMPKSVDKSETQIGFQSVQGGNTSYVVVVSSKNNVGELYAARAIEFENAFSSYTARDIGLLHYLQFVEDEDGSIVGALLSDDWDNVRKIANFLQFFYDLTREISGSHYVTTNSHFLKICEVSCYLKQLISSENDNDDLLGKIASNMREKFDKYWATPKKMNKMIFISCVLDPRHKFVYVGFALQMMFGKEGPILEKGIRDYTDLLFGEYVKSFSKDKDSQHFSSLSSSSFENSSSLLSSSELQKYLAEENEVESKNFNILSWWKINSPRFPVLAEIARDVLAIPISSVASECAFSTGGRILDSFRSSLTPKLVQTLVCLQDWIRSESRPISVEEDIDVLEQHEQDGASKGNPGPSSITFCIRNDEGDTQYALCRRMADSTSLFAEATTLKEDKRDD